MFAGIKDGTTNAAVYSYILYKYLYNTNNTLPHGLVISYMQCVSSLLVLAVLCWYISVLIATLQGLFNFLEKLIVIASQLGRQPSQPVGLKLTKNKKNLALNVLISYRPTSTLFVQVMWKS